MSFQFEEKLRTSCIELCISLIDGFLVIIGKISKQKQCSDVTAIINTQTSLVSQIVKMCFISIAHIQRMENV